MPDVPNLQVDVSGCSKPWWTSQNSWDNARGWSLFRYVTNCLRCFMVLASICTISQIDFQAIHHPCAGVLPGEHSLLCFFDCVPEELSKLSGAHCGGWEGEAQSKLELELGFCYVTPDWVYNVRLQFPRPYSGATQHMCCTHCFHLPNCKYAVSSLFQCQGQCIIFFFYVVFEW